jgi:ankyrin repeat protein
MKGNIKEVIQNGDVKQFNNFFMQQSSIKQIEFYHRTIKSGKIILIQKCIEYFSANGQDHNIHALWKNYTPLMTAASAGQLDIVKYLITEHKADVAQKTDAGTASSLAVGNNHYNIVEYFEQYMEVDSAVLEAIARNGDALELQRYIPKLPKDAAKYENLLTMLLEGVTKRFATLDHDFDRSTKLKGLANQEAAQKINAEREKLVAEIVAVIKKIQEYDELKILFLHDGHAPMNRAIAIGSVEIVDSLYDVGAATERHFKVAIEKGNPQILQLVSAFAYPYNISYDDQGNIIRYHYYDTRDPGNEKTALYIAIQKLIGKEGQEYQDRLAIVRYLLTSLEIDPDMLSSVNKKAYTPLFFAIDHGLFDVVKLLVDREGIIILDPKTRRYHSGSPKPLATDLNAGCHDEAQRHIITPLYQAIEKFKQQKGFSTVEYRILRYLIINGSKTGHLDLNLASDIGSNKYTPLLQAISKNMLPVIELLIHYGADLNVKGVVDNIHYLPIDFAKKHSSRLHNQKIIKLLKTAESLDNNEIPDLEGFPESSALALTNKQALDLQKSEAITIEEYIALKSTVIRLESMVQALWPMIEAHERIKSEILAIKANPYQCAFYQELRWELTSGYALAQLILTGKVKLAPEEFGVNLGTCGRALSAAGEHIPIFGIVATVVGAAMVRVSEERRKLMLEHFKSIACDYVDFVGISEAVARKIVQSNLPIGQKQESIFAKIKGYISEHVDLANILRNFGQGENYGEEVLHGKKDAKIIAGLIISKILTKGSQNPEHIAELVWWVSEDLNQEIMLDGMESSNHGTIPLVFSQQEHYELGVMGDLGSEAE